MSSQQAHAHPWYTAVFGWLFLLTILEVWIAESAFGWTPIVLGLTVLAVVKAALVALYFMHLKFERMRLILFVSMPIFAVGLLLVVLYVDGAGIGPY